MKSQFGLNLAFFF